MAGMPFQPDLTSVEISSLLELANGFSSRTIPAGRVARLVQFGLIQEVMGGLMITPTGRVVARRLSTAK